MIAVLSDIHANGRAFKAAIRRLAEVEVARVIMLGDLLTYGVDVEETLDQVEALTESGAVLLMGNHDRLYLDLDDGNREYYDSLPEWIQESVDFTLTRLDVDRFRALPWKTEYSLGPMFFAHANPFGFGDWSYLHSQSELERAADVLLCSGFEWGFFGHTHRPLTQEVRDGVTIANPGSVGQPRSGRRDGTMITLSVDAERPSSIRVRGVEFDRKRHVQSLASAGFSEATLARLARFFD